MVQAVHRSNALFGVPDTTELSATMGNVLDAAHHPRLLGDAPEPLRYSFLGWTPADRWTATRRRRFFHGGLAAVPACDAALRDDQFGVVSPDTSRVGVPDQPCSAFCVADALIPQWGLLGRDDAAGARRTTRCALIGAGIRRRRSTGRRASSCPAVLGRTLTQPGVPSRNGRIVGARFWESVHRSEDRVCRVPVQRRQLGKLGPGGGGMLET